MLSGSPQLGGWGGIIYPWGLEKIPVDVGKNILKGSEYSLGLSDGTSHGGKNGKGSVTRKNP